MSDVVRSISTVNVTVSSLAAVPIIESIFRPHGEMLLVNRGAFIDAPESPAIIMHPVDAATFQVATETGLAMSEPSVAIEGLRRYLTHRIDREARAACRRLDRMVDGMHARAEREAARERAGYPCGTGCPCGFDSEDCR